MAASEWNEEFFRSTALDTTYGLIAESVAASVTVITAVREEKADQVTALSTMLASIERYVWVCEGM